MRATRSTMIGPVRLAGIWTTFYGDRGTKSKPIPGPHNVLRLPDDSTERRRRADPSEGDAGERAASQSLARALPLDICDQAAPFGRSGLQSQTVTCCVTCCT